MTGALKGIKVADFSWSVTGPAAARYLADHGALVVKVESEDNPDIGRISVPFKDGIPGLDRSAYFANPNAGKYSITLDLKRAKAVEVAKRLTRWADILIESFSPGVMKRLGLDYESVKAINPAIIYASTSQLGQTGPFAHYRGYGQQAAAIAGFVEVTGWPDRDPVGPYLSYTDFVAHRYLIIALLVALEHRRRTGRGQYIDQSQAESSIHFVAPAMLDCAINGRTLSRPGNREPYAAPHGAYRCRGEDRWCVIAVYTDEEWEAFSHAIGRPPWSADPRFTTILGRKENEEELDRLVQEWTSALSPEEVMNLLQQAGVAAGIVEKAEDLHRDPQFSHRHHFWVLNHPVIGPHTYDAPGFRLSRTPAELRMPAPCLGEHNYYVCTELLGMRGEEFAELLQAGVFS